MRYGSYFYTLLCLLHFLVISNVFISMIRMRKSSSVDFPRMALNHFYFAPSKEVGTFSELCSYLAPIILLNGLLHLWKQARRRSLPFGTSVTGKELGIRGC